MSLREFARQHRKRPTVAEWLLWEHVRGKALGVKFRRQVPMGPYIVDFYCPAARLVVEVDGGSHDDSEKRAYRQRRDEVLTEMGLQVLRVGVADVRQSMPEVLACLRAAVDHALSRKEAA